MVYLIYRLGQCESRWRDSAARTGYLSWRLRPIRSEADEGYKTGNFVNITLHSFRSSLLCVPSIVPRASSALSLFFLLPVTMKGCLVVSGASPRNSPRPPARKCVSFCGSNSSSSSDEEQEIVEVHVADDWDRTPCEITPKLTHK